MASIIRKSFWEKVLNKFGYVQYKSSDNHGDIIPSSKTNAGGFGTSLAYPYGALVENYKSWVFTSIDKIGNSIASLPAELFVYVSKGKLLKGLPIKNQLRMYKTNQERKAFLTENNIEKIRIYDHPFLDLINNPNIIDTRFTLWKNIVVRMELAGYCGVYMPMNGLGIPGELWALPLFDTAELTMIPDQQNVISGYLYTDGEVRTKFEIDEVSFIKYPNPKSIYEGLSPLMAQIYPYNIDLFLMQQQSNLLRNKASFGNVFTTDQPLQQMQIDELKEQILAQYAGALNTGKAIVTHSGLKLDTSGLAQTTKDMMLSEVNEFARDKLITSYQLSPGNVGLQKDVNRSTAEVMSKDYVENCLKPKTMIIEENFERDILPKYDDALTLDFKLPETSNKELDIKETEMELKTGLKTINEKRAEKEGLPPVSWGDLPWIPFNLSQPTGETQQPVIPEPVKNKSLSVQYWTEERKIKAAQIFSEKIEVRKDLFLTIIRKHFKEQETLILQRLNELGKNIKGNINGWGANKVRRWLSQHKDRLVDININKIEEANRLAAEAVPIYTEIIKEVGGERLAEFGVDIAFNVNDPAVQTWIGERLKSTSKDIQETTFNDIQAILREGFQEGVGLVEVADRIKAKFESWDKGRALMISRTETISASNFSDLESVKQSGLEKRLRKFWLNEVDARETHQIAGSVYASDGAIEINGNFQVGADSMKAPGNGSLAEENINCRCTLGYVEQS